MILQQKKIMESHKVHENYIPKVQLNEPLKVLSVEVKKLFVKMIKYLKFLK